MLAEDQVKVKAVESRALRKTPQGEAPACLCPENRALGAASPPVQCVGPFLIQILRLNFTERSVIPYCSHFSYLELFMAENSHVQHSAVQG